jgi:hypothetical protein
MKRPRPLLALAMALGAVLACSAPGAGQPAAFPTAGITVQAYPQVEITTPTHTPVPPLPPSDTPLPAPPTATATLVPTDTATALIRVKPPTATVRVGAPTQRPVVKTAAPSNTPAPAAGPLVYRGVSFVSARADPTRNNGSYTTLSLEFAGGQPPYSLKHDSLVGPINPNGDGAFENAGVNYIFIHFTILRTCGGPVVGTVTLTSGDGQTLTHDYYVASAPCS